MKVRRANKGDAKILNSFLTKLICDEKKYDVNINDECIVTSLYEELILDDNNCILIAENENDIIGYLYGYLVDIGDAYLNSKAWIEAMFVECKYRNAGVGSLLIDSFKAWSKSKNVKYIELKVCNGNKNAIYLYDKKGFKNIKSIMTMDLEE